MASFQILGLFGAGIITGLIGALALSFAANLLTRASINFRGADASLVLAATIGAIAGLLFTVLGFYGGDNNLVFWPIAFVVWQVAVGVSISTSLQRWAASA
jgi:uncharacterized protein YacL